MEQAVKEAIRQGGIRNLPFEQQILVARALLIIKAIPDDYGEKGNNTNV